MDVRIRAMNRFGLGARIGERREISDARGWLKAQVDTGLEDGAGGSTLAERGRLIADLRTAQRSRDQDALADVRARIRDTQDRDFRRLLTRRVTTDQPFVERLVAFWSNHLCVSILAKRQVAVLAGHYEDAVIRRHALGNFTEMVIASAKHPAMLFYLDNLQSIGPGSRVGRQTARRGTARGLNENYARELLELHTVGVRAGYQQADVEALARVLTGWTVAGVGPGARSDETLGFVFRPILHEPGTKSVLGRGYPSSGIEEGEAAIRDLCAHPATATFVAEKLVRHFVDDEPPPSAVEEIARVFRSTDGDLRAVSVALVDLDAAWDPARVKFRTPQDWLTAVFRAVRASEAPEPMAPLLRQLRHTPWAPAAPKGFGDSRREWADPDSLMNRAELARSVARGAGRDGDFDPRMVSDVVDVDPDDPLLTMLADTSLPAPERLALAFGGPAFQWR